MRLRFEFVIAAVVVCLTCHQLNAQGMSVQDTSMPKYGYGSDACEEEALRAHLSGLTQELTLRLNAAARTDGATVARTDPQAALSSHEKLVPAVSTAQSQINEDSYPEPIQGDTICGPEGSSTFPCSSQQIPKPLTPDEKRRVIQASQSIGRLTLKIHDTSEGLAIAGPPKAVHYLWATAVVVAPGVIASSCHALESLLVHKKNKWQLQREVGQDLIVDFGEDTREYAHGQDYDDSHQFEVTDVLGYSNDKGLDVILLEVEKTSIVGGNSLPNPLELSSTPITNPNGNLHDIVLVGYPDFYHPVDFNAVGRGSYGFYKSLDFAKFAALGDVTEIDGCRKYQVLLHTASTTVGNSGSAVLDLDRDSSNNSSGTLIGFHTCCSLPSQESDSQPPHPKIPCAELKNTYENQAISAWSVLGDSTLCSVLNQHGVECPPHTHSSHDSK